MNPDAVLALEMLIATYDSIFLDTPAEIKKLLEDIYDGIEVTEQQIEEYLSEKDEDYVLTYKHAV
jgi:hypothetical protein